MSTMSSTGIDFIPWFRPHRILSTWVLSGGAADTAIVFTLVEDAGGAKGVIVRHHPRVDAKTNSIPSFQYTLRGNGPSVTIESHSVLTVDSGRLMWNGLRSLEPAARYKAWKTVSPEPYTVPPDEFIRHSERHYWEEQAAKAKETEAQS